MRPTRIGPYDDVSAPPSVEGLAAAPSPPGCLVGDPVARRIYAQARDGRGFFRYDAEDDAWQPLADAPFAATGACGAVQVAGTIYTAYAGGARLGVYDVDDDFWTTIPAAVPAAVLAADGDGLLYQVAGRDARRFDPRDGTIETLAQPPFDFAAGASALAGLDRVLLGHGSDGDEGRFASYDPATDEWSSLAPPPGAGAGAAVDPVNRAYLITAPVGGGLYRYDVDRAAWQTIVLPAGVAVDGPVAWLSAPASGFYFGGGTDWTRRSVPPGFILATPSRGVVPPGGEAEISVRFDASDRFGGDHEAELSIRTNDPQLPLARVPARMTVVGLPQIGALAGPIDFGPVFVGTSRRIDLAIDNLGTAPLSLVVAADRATFTASPATLEVPARETAQLSLYYAPAAAGAESAWLELTTNDPATPVVRLDLTGSGVDRPIVTITPQTLDSELIEDTTTTHALTIANAGLGPLEFSIAVETAAISFITTGVESGSVPPGESLSVPVFFDGALPGPGTHAARLVVTTNDPFVPQWTIPASLTVRGLPRLALGGEPVQLESTIAFGIYALNTVHEIPIVIPPAGSGTIEIEIEGDYGNDGEFAIATAEGGLLGQIGDASADCAVTSRIFPIDAARLAGLTHDRLLEIDVANVDSVRPFCPSNRHTVRVTYVGATDRLDFGTVFVGGARPLGLIVENLGSAPLELTASSDDASFAPEPANLQVAPGTAAALRVEFAPLAVGQFDGTLRLLSNDPRAPDPAIVLAGRGAEPPALRLDTDEISVTLLEGGRSSHPLVLANDGAGPLEFILSISADPPDFVRGDVTSGTIAPGASRTVALSFDAAPLAVGTWPATLEVVSNDLHRPQVVVPLTVDVVEAPNLEVLGQRVTLESSIEFDAVGAVTHHRLPLELAATGGAQIDVVGDGDFGASSEFAIVRAEGVVLGSIGTTGSDCIPAVGRFSIDADRLAALVDDGLVEIDVFNGTTVDAICEKNAHTVRLHYDAIASVIDFGDVFVGTERSRAVRLRNAGQRPLQVESITSDTPSLVPARTALVVAPGAAEVVEIDFRPTTSGPVDAALSIASDDPDSPTIVVPLVGHASDPPVLSVAPASIEVALDEGSSRVETLTVSNHGATPLEFDLVPAAPAGFDPGYTLFATDGGGGNLYTLDSGTGAAVFVGPMGIGAPALAVDPTTGVMYVGQGGGRSWLYAVDPASAVLTAIGDSGLGVSGYAALEFDAEGVLYAAVNVTDGAGTGGDSLAIVDELTGEARVVGSFGGGIGTAGGSPGIGGIAFDPASGILLGASGAQSATIGPPALYSIDLVTGEAIFLRRIVDTAGQPPAGGIGSLQFDGQGRLFAGTGRGTGNLLRIDPATGIYTLVGHLFPSAVGGLALRADPVDLSFVDVSPTSGTVAPGETASLVVTADARALSPGRYQARLVLRSNDPERPEAAISLAIDVSGIPDIALPGESVSLDSTRSFSGVGAGTTHRLEIVAASAGGARLQVTANGDFGAVNEVADVHVDGVALGRVGHARSDCFPARKTFVIAAGDFATIAADGEVEVTIDNAPTVGEFCGDSTHAVSLIYDQPRERVDFGTVFPGHPVTRPLTLRNDGRAELHIDAIASDRAEVTVDPTTPLVVPPFGSVELAMTYRPTGAGDLAGSLSIESDDPDEPLLVIALDGRAVGAPRAVISPGTIEAALPPGVGRTTERILQLSNDGDSELRFQVELIETPAEPPPVGQWGDLGKGDGSADGVGSNTVLRSDGPDAFGYRYRDGDDPAGPRFDWIDLTLAGQPLELVGDDRTSAALPLGFSFPFYGASFDAVHVSSNGWLSLSSDKTSYSNPDSLPNAGFSVPENLIAPFWDDLDLRQADAVRYLADGDRFVVQYTEVDRFASVAELTFQVVLHRSGRIVFHYLRMDGALDSATIGIQNGDRTIGLLVAYNEPYVRDGLAVEFAPLAPWAEITPAAGTVAAGQSVELRLALDGGGLVEGDYAARLRLRSNDPANGQIDVPIALRAATVELSRFEIQPRVLNTASRGASVQAVLEFPPGYDPRRVVLASVTLDGVVDADPGNWRVEDGDADGREELVVSFDRRAVLDWVGTAGGRDVTVSGEIAGQAWFEGTTTVSTIDRGRER
ncbi:MAG TPA: choice-of-anchor D domain-containing protein [Candidatus Polarisedimenticolaceae bacterium]|nr:choice-of-anchor D domain-containing protein [Candidatus Polarisedimenticolaceae bacterium]